MKRAVETDFFNKIYYQLTKQLKESNDLFLGFTCRWSTFVTAVEDALGALSGIKRLLHFLNTKEYLQGGISLADTLYKCSHVIEETFGKIDITTEQQDGVKRTNKMTKEFQKFLAAFEVVEALPAEYDKLKEDMEISITGYIYKPVKFYEK